MEICKLVKMSNSNFEGLTVTEPEGNGKYWSRMNGKKFYARDRIRRIEANMVLVKNALPFAHVHIGSYGQHTRLETTNFLLSLPWSI